MLEQIAQIGPMLGLAGLMAGWTAEAVSRSGGYGLIPDMIVGLVGSVLVGGLVWMAVSHGAGMLGLRRRRTGRRPPARPVAFGPSRHLSAMARCQGCGAELEDATQQFCGGDRCLHVWWPGVAWTAFTRSWPATEAPAAGRMVGRAPR